MFRGLGSRLKQPLYEWVSLFNSIQNRPQIEDGLIPVLHNNITYDVVKFYYKTAKTIFIRLNILHIFRIEVPVYSSMVFGRDHKPSRVTLYTLFGRRFAQAWLLQC